MIWVVCEALGKFPHEVEQELTLEDVTEYHTLLKIRREAEDKARKQAEAKAKRRR